VLVAVTSVLTVLSPALAGSRSAGATTSLGSVGSDLAFIEQVMYRTSITAFVSIADHGDPWFDWTTDGCSAPVVGSTGRTFDFRLPCRRHDFGYRNLQRMEHRYGAGATFWNATSRARVDRQLYADMNAHCRARRWHDQPSCIAWATTFYAAVRVAGGP
jgi:hypothetical protein